MAANPLRGYRRLPGTAHRYLTPNGVEISEYEYRSRKAKRAGFRNYSQQRRFRETQEFLRLRFNIRSIDPSLMVEAGSDLEAAAFELQADHNYGRSGVFAHRAKNKSRFSKLLAAAGAPDWYFFRYWYSETVIG